MKFTTLIPKAYNDGTPVPDRLLRRVIAQLREQFGASTVESEVHGYWSDDDGILYHDSSSMVSVGCDNSRLNDAIRAVRRIGRLIKQKAMYFEVFGYDGLQILAFEDERS